MTHDLPNSRFARRLRAGGAALDDRLCRRLVLRYARLYQDVYWFEQLADALTFLELAEGDPAGLEDLRPAVVEDVHEAMWEYFISLNEVATAVHRLLDEAPMGVDDVLVCIGHIWNAHECNETVPEFSQREDTVLCGLLAALLAPAG